MYSLKIYFSISNNYKHDFLSVSVYLELNKKNHLSRPSLTSFVSRYHFNFTKSLTK